VIEPYAVVAARIRQELAELEPLVTRAQRAISSARQLPEDQDLYLDSAVLNLHDFYTGLERIFYHIATNVDSSVPVTREWHRELLRQMGTALPQVRPEVLSPETVKALDEYLRFRHVVRNVYTFEFEPARIERLVKQLEPSFSGVRDELVTFAGFLDLLAQE